MKLLPSDPKLKTVVCHSNATASLTRLAFYQRNYALNYTHFSLGRVIAFAGLKNSILCVSGCPMEHINEVLFSVLFLSLNPLAWALAVISSKNSENLRKPVIAAVMTQTGICCLLVGLIVWADIAFPITDIFTILLAPCVLSGILISAIVILFTKRPRLLHLFSSHRVDQMTYKSI
jgi:hypothetical protein